MKKNLTSEDIKTRLKEIIVNDLKVDVLLNDIKDYDSLYEDGIGLDSINIISFIVLIEDKFSIKFETGEISAFIFANINNLTIFIDSKIRNQNA